jgi:hypothetical protein
VDHCLPHAPVEERRGVHVLRAVLDLEIAELRRAEKDLAARRRAPFAAEGRRLLELEGAVEGDVGVAREQTHHRHVRVRAPRQPDALDLRPAEGVAVERGRLDKGPLGPTLYPVGSRADVLGVPVRQGAEHLRLSLVERWLEEVPWQRQESWHDGVRIRLLPLNVQRCGIDGADLLDQRQLRRGLRQPPLDLGDLNAVTECEIVRRQRLSIVPREVRPEAEGGVHPTVREEPPAIGVQLRHRRGKDRVSVLLVVALSEVGAEQCERDAVQAGGRLRDALAGLNPHHDRERSLLGGGCRVRSIRGRNATLGRRACRDEEQETE